MQWTSKSNTNVQNALFAKHQDENHADHFFFCKHGVIQKEFVREKQTVNSAFYVEFIRRPLKRISRLRPQFRAEGSLFLLHDSAFSHSALVVKYFPGQTWCCGGKPLTLIS
jgi:hypothetical protein